MTVGQERTFYEAIRSAIAAIEVSANVKAFARVWVAPYLDMDMLLRIPRWPAAVISDKGFSINQSNGKVKTGAFEVAVVACTPRDQVGDASILDIMDLGDLLITGLEYDSDNSVNNAAAGATDSIITEAGLMVVARKFTFTYEIRRT